MKKTEGKSKIVRYNKWGYIFLIPFVLVYFSVDSISQYDL